MFGVILGLIVGGAQPLQTSINSRLRQRLRSPMLSSIASFTVAAIIIGIILLIMQHNLYIPLGRIAQEPLWIWCGGLCGDAIVIFSILCLPKLGSVETVVWLVLGQIITGLAIDNWGIFGSDIIRCSLLRFIGAVLVLVGSIVIAKANASSDNNKNHSGDIWLYRLLDFIAGAAGSIQIAINGRLGSIVGLSFRATMVSMLVGLSGALVIIAVLYIAKGKGGVIDYSLPVSQGKWWMWSGGVCACVIVGGNVVLAGLLGTGLSAILNILGQTFGGVVIDATGFLGIDVKPVTLTKIIGIAAMVAGAAMVSM